MSIMVISRFLFIACIITACTHVIAKANDAVSGKFVTAKGASLEFIQQKENATVALKMGHQTIVANTDHKANGLCYMFSSLDIIYPINLEQHSAFDCLAGSATVVNSQEPFLLENGKEIETSKIRVHRYGEVEVDGRLYRRPGGEMIYHLYVSAEFGLVGIDLSLDSEQSIYRRVSK